MKSRTALTQLFRPLAFVLLLPALAACGASDATLQRAGGGRAPYGGAFRSERVAVGEEIDLAVGDGETTAARIWLPRGTPVREGLLFVTGIDGGFLEPSDGIYDRMAAQALRSGMASIFVQYRSPGDIEPSVADAMAGAKWLQDRGVDRLAVVGWSFGGAVMVHTAARLGPRAITLIGFAPQSLDTEPVAQFRGRSILLMASPTDENVPYISSQQILDDAPPQARQVLHTVENANHALTDTGNELDPLVYSWLDTELHSGFLNTRPN